MAGNYVRQQIKRVLVRRHCCHVKWRTDKTAFRKWKVQGNIQGAASFSPIRNSTVCLTAVCLFQLAVPGGRALKPPLATVTLFLSSNLPTSALYIPPYVFFHPLLWLFFFFFNLPPPPPSPPSQRWGDEANEGSLWILLSGPRQHTEAG